MYAPRGGDDGGEHLPLGKCQGRAESRKGECGLMRTEGANWRGRHHGDDTAAEEDIERDRYVRPPI